jgi:DNA-binding transcriptional MerR regulator
VRTLRVYERAGLITPQRSANGWRLYGERELRRLNYVITLKTLGLTLREIRDVLSTATPPPLLGVLRLQLASL